MRVVAVGDGLFEDRRGGGRRYLSEVAARLCGHGHQVSVVGPRLDPSLAPREDLAGVRVFRHDPGGGSLPARLLARYRSARRAFEDAAAGGCDVVNVHFAQTAFAALRSPRARGLPVVVNFQGPWPGEVWVERQSRHRGLPWATPPLHNLGDLAAVSLMYLLERAVARRAGRFIVLSRFSARLLQRWYGVPPASISIIPSGVDTARFRPHPRPDLLREEMGLSRTGSVLFTARRLVSRMGIELLLRALAALECRDSTLLYVAGDGPLRDHLRRSAEALGVAPMVRWLGAISEADLVRFYQAADLVVVPTVAYEGFGLVTVEALACGTPVVATPVGASPEILEGLWPALVAPAAEPGALAGAVARARAEAPGPDECRGYALARYSWDVVFPAVEAELVRAAEGL